MTDAPYGYCPYCGAPGITRERRLGGNDRCEKGHDYPSLMSVTEKPVALSSAMTSIPLRDVVAFLRPRDALPILDGAPFIGADGQRHSFQPADASPRTVAMLYLGDSEICPAAEGWAARVLGLALCWPPGVRGMFGTSPQGVALFVPQGERVSVQNWTWINFPAWTRMSGPMPATPVARLAAVLRYEMERAR